MNRRDFLKYSLGSVALSALPKNLPAFEGRKVTPLTPLNVRRRTIHIGLEKAFKVLHISDTHIALADNRDSDSKIKMASWRQREFANAEHYFDEAITYARANAMPVIHTGDLIDFVSEENLDFAARHLQKGDFLVSSGNHEFSQDLGASREDEAFKLKSYDKVQEAFPNDLTFYTRIMNGVNFVAIDDVYYNVTEQLHELVEKEMKRGLPVVLLCHVPFYTPRLCDYNLKTTHGKTAYLTGIPLSITSKFAHDDSLPESEQWRNDTVQKRADKPTLEFLKWLHDQKQLKAILCGHLHWFYEEPFSETAMQYVVGGNFNGDAYEFTFE